MIEWIQAGAKAKLSTAKLARGDGGNGAANGAQEKRTAHAIGHAA
jgi:hypothetical protein